VEILLLINLTISPLFFDSFCADNGPDAEKSKATKKSAPKKEKAATATAQSSAAPAPSTSVPNAPAVGGPALRQPANSAMPASVPPRPTFSLGMDPTA